MYVGSQAETEQSCRLKIRSQQAFILMTVSLDNSPLSQSLQPGKINGIAALKCHEGRFEISGVLLTFMSPPISFQFPVSDHHRRTLSTGGVSRGRGEQSKVWLFLLPCTYFFTISFCSFLCYHPVLCSLCAFHNSALMFNSNIAHKYSYSGLPCLLRWHTSKQSFYFLSVKEDLDCDGVTQDGGMEPAFTR